MKRGKYVTCGITTCALLCCALSVTSASASSIPLVNTDFSDPANEGTIGGGALGASGNAQIGVGPWDGSYSGVAGLLAPPVLTIGNGQATISQIAVGALGIANQGFFYQGSTATVQSSEHYVLAADVGASAALTLSLLSGGNAGLALTAGITPVASTSTATASNIGLTSARHGRVHVALGYDSSASDVGSLTVSLYTDPTGVAAVDLLSSISFDNVALTAAPASALPPSAVGSAAGTPQAATVNTSFPTPLVVTVVDAQGNPLAGVTVTFGAPSTGAGATLVPTTAITDVGGRAEVAAQANGTPGTYDVTASIAGGAAPTTFRLTNTGAGQPTITSVAGGDGQAQTVTLGFECRLAVQVFDGSEPAPGATVVFASPSSGASALLTDNSSSGTQLSETTDNNGIASVIATADVTPGSYVVTATLSSLSSGPLTTPLQIAAYPMTNLAVGDRMFGDGFENEPAQCGNFVE